MKPPKANLRDISVEKVAPDVISALFLVSLVRKLYGNRKAIKQLQRLILENKPVDSEKFIRANFKLGIPLVIITKTEHMKGRFLPALRKLGLPKEKVNQVVQRALEIFPLVIRGNGFASLISDEKGEKKFAFVAVPPKANPFLMKHEMGHILYRLKEGRPMIKGFKITVEPFLQSLSFLSRIYSKKSKYGIEKEEGIAWDIAGVPKDNPLRQASQKTYETSMGFAASGLKWVLASAFSPYIIQLAGKLKSVIKKNVLKEEALMENSGLIVKRSPIHGNGVFATRLIYPGVIEDKKSWSDAINHSKNPNAELLQNGDIKILRRISAGQELTFDYRTMKQWPGTEIHWEDLNEDEFSSEKHIKIKTMSYKVNDWVKGKTPVLFVVGYSGAGKSTLSKKLARKYKAKYISIDTEGKKKVTINGETKPMNELRLDDFIDTLWNKIIKPALNSSKRVIIDGLQTLFLEDAQIRKLKDCAFMIPSTSMLRSSIRAVRREKRLGAIFQNAGGNTLMWAGMYRLKKILKEDIEDIKVNKKWYDVLNVQRHEAYEKAVEAAFKKHFKPKHPLLGPKMSLKVGGVGFEYLVKFKLYDKKGKSIFTQPAYIIILKRAKKPVLLPGGSIYLRKDLQGKGIGGEIMGGVLKSLKELQSNRSMVVDAHMVGKYTWSRLPGSKLDKLDKTKVNKSFDSWAEKTGYKGKRPEKASEFPKEFLLSKDAPKFIRYTVPLTETKKKPKYAKLKDNKVPLTPEERAEVMQKKAIWHHGPGGKPAPAVWKSINPTTGEVTYVTNTHRAYQARPTLNGAISIYHRFIKSTA